MRRIQQHSGVAETDLARSSRMKVCWDLGFKEVTGDKVYLLTRAPGVTHSLSSNGAAGKKWLVTKIASVDNKPICWFLPIEVEVGESQHIVLNEENAFDLPEVFEAAVASGH